MTTSIRRRLRARNPSENGIGKLFDEHAPMVLALCRYLLRDPHAAEDAAQETFLNAHRSMLGGTHPRDPAAWLATIARNECRRMWRAPRVVPLDESANGILHDPAEVVADRAELAAVADAIAALPARQREALVLREFCGLSYEQVASAMEASESVVDSLLSRARRRLAEQVQDIPRVARDALVVPASLREELTRLIPGLDPAGAATAATVASGAGGAATLTGLGSSPAVAKVAASGAAAVALALPFQATVRGDQGPPKRVPPRAQAAARTPEPKVIALRAQPAAPATPSRTKTVVREVGTRTDSTERTPRRAVRRSQPPAPDLAPPAAPAASSSSGSDPVEPEPSSSGPGPGPDGSGSGSSGSGSSGPGSESSGSGSSGSGSSGSGSSGPDTSGSSGSGDSGSSGSGSSGSGSESSGSGSSGSGSSGGSESSGSGSSGSGSSGSGESGSDGD